MKVVKEGRKEGRKEERKDGRKQSHHFLYPCQAQLEFAGPVVPLHCEQRVQPRYRGHVLQPLNFQAVVRTFDSAVGDFAVGLQTTLNGRSQADLVETLGQCRPAHTCTNMNIYVCI